MTCTNQYQKFTIRSLFKSLEEIMAENSEINLDSEIIVSNLNMEFFNQEIKIYPTHDYKDGSLKVGMYLNPCERKNLLESLEQSTEETCNTEKTLTWLNKYKGK